MGVTGVGESEVQQIVPIARLPTKVHEDLKPEESFQ